MQWLNLGMEDPSLHAIQHSKVIEALLGEIETGVLDGSDPGYTGHCHPREDIMDLNARQTSFIFSEVIIINVIINVKFLYRPFHSSKVLYINI